MRRSIEGYRWMWHAVGRWHGGPLWRRLGLFSFYVLGDLVGAAPRPSQAGLVVAALAIAGVLSVGGTADRVGAPAGADRTSGAGWGAGYDVDVSREERGDELHIRIRYQLAVELEHDFDYEYKVRMGVDTGVDAPARPGDLRPSEGSS